ncbi:MAG: hypothetical protein QXT63_04170 [Thermoplasmata archaeon]
MYSNGNNRGERNNVSSYELLELGYPKSRFTSMRAWKLYVYQNSSAWGKGAIEEFRIMIRVATDPWKVDSDADGLGDGPMLRINDSAKISYLMDKGIRWKDEGDGNYTFLGEQSFGTDPWSKDTDADGLEDIEEIEPSGDREATSPTSADSDGDGFNDKEDIDPLHDLMIKVFVDSIRVYTKADGYFEVDGNEVVFDIEPFIVVTVGGKSVASRHKTTAWNATGGYFNTVQYDSEYMFDVKDNESFVKVVVSAWEDDVHNELNDDDHLDINYDENKKDVVLEHDMSKEYSLYGGEGPDAIVTFQIYTAKLNRTNTILINGTDSEYFDTGKIVRYTGEQRMYAFFVESTSNEGLFVEGLNVILVSRSTLLNSMFNVSLFEYSPGGTNELGYFEDAKFSAYDNSKNTQNAPIVGVISVRLSGLDAMRLITDYLLVNSTGNKSAEARVLSTAMLHQLGLNKDVLRLIPWLGVSQSEQGDLPKTTLGLILEGLQGLAVSITEMLYEGLVAIGNFLESISSALSAWGQAAWKTQRDYEC